MATSDDAFVVSDCRGGQNSAAPPLALGQTECTEAINVEWYRATVARKRRGSRQPLFAGDAGWTSQPTAGPAGTSVYETILSWIDLDDISHVLLQDTSHNWYRHYIYSLGSWQSNYLGDLATSPLTAAYFNGKLVLAYDNLQPRLHVFENHPVFGWRIRRHGMGVATGPPVITLEAGLVSDTRIYRTVALRKNGDVIISRGEPSAVTTPPRTLAGQQARATPSSLSDGPDTFELQVASDDDNYATWWVVGQAATSGGDVVDNYPNLITAGLEPAPQEGLFQPFPSVKYLVVDDNRLLGAGDWETTNDADQQKIYFTPVLGDLDQADDERYVNTVDQKDYLYLDGGDRGGPITGFGEPVFGSVIVFKRHQIWKLMRTGIRALPYRAECLSKAVGCVSQRTVTVGEDSAGAPCLYFMSARGPYRLGVRGLEYLGAAIEDWIDRITPVDTVHIRFGVYYPDRKQVWWWIALDGQSVPSNIVVFHVATNGWSVYQGAIAQALATCLAPRGMGAQNGSDGMLAPTHDPLSRVPYVSLTPQNTLHECDALHPITGAALHKDGMAFDGTTWSFGTAFQATLTTRPIPIPLWHRAAVTRGVLIAEPGESLSLDVTLTADFGLQQESATVLMSPVGTETRVIRDVSIGITAARAIQVTVGDASAIASQWVIDALALRTRMEADT